MDIVGGKRLKKIAIIICLIIFIFYSYSYEKIVSWDNEEKNADEVLFDGTDFILNKNKKIDLTSISYIIFNLQEDKEKPIESILEDVDAEELLKRASIMEKKYPDSSLIVLYDDGIQKLNKDGTRFTRSRYSVKIMNQKELSYSMLSFYYSKGKYESKIIMARSISLDGEISYLKESDIAYTKPKQGLSFFSGRKNEVIIKATIPDVKVGSIVDFEWETVEASPEDENQFYPKWFFGGDSPVFESKVKYIVPNEKEFYWVAKNFSPFKSAPEIVEKEGYKIYSFERGECPPFIGEPYSPPMRELIPIVFGSLSPDQTYLSNWLSKFMKERMIPNDLMEIAVYQVLEDANAKTEEQMVAALYRFVQEYIHYRSIKTSLSSGFSGHPAAETFENRYGDCIDKSILFSTLLNILDIEAYPVIIATNDNPRPLYNEIGIIAGNHAITEIHLKENEKKIIYLDSTSSTYRYPVFRDDDQGVPAWNPILNTVREIQTLDSILNTQKFNKQIVLFPDGNGEVNSYSEYFGDWEAGIRGYFISVKKEEIKSLLNSIVAREYPGSILKEYNFKDPTDYSDNFFLSLSYKALLIAKKTSDFLIMNIPVNYDFGYVTLEKRKHPLVFPTTGGKKNKISIILPDGYKIKGLPESVNIKNKYFSYVGTYSLKDKNIIFEDHFERTGCRIPVEDYEEYREEILKVDYFIRIPLIFEKE